MIRVAGLRRKARPRGACERRQDSPMEDLEIRYAKRRDLPWLVDHDDEMSEEYLLKKIDDGQLILLLEDNDYTGWLRFGYFWDCIPFLNLIMLEEHAWGRGLGTRLMLFWEEDMRAQGFDQVMTSTLADEEAQHFYRKLGYQDSGAILLPGEILEIVFVKALI